MNEIVPLSSLHKPELKLRKVSFIALAPVSWGDGFMRDVSLLALHTDCGKVGLGSAYTSATKLEATWEIYKSYINWQALNPAQTSDWVTEAAKKSENQGFDGNGPDTIPALSAINIAMWDLLGQCLTEPIVNLIGQAHWQSLPAYASLELSYDLNGPGDALKHSLEAARSQGFRAIKLYLPRFGYRTPALSLQDWQLLEKDYLIQARKIVGPNITLMLDTFGSALDWPNNLAWAKEIQNTLTAHNYLWFEEPLAPDNLQGHLALKNNLSTERATEQTTDGSKTDSISNTTNRSLKISGGEFFTEPHKFEYWAKHRVVDILQPDCTISGGLSTLLNVRHHAQENGLDVIPHGWSSAVGLATDVQFLAATHPESLCLVEYMPGPHVKDILKDNPFTLDAQGRLPVPQGPGLGIQLDWDKVAQHEFPFTGLKESKS